MLANLKALRTAQGLSQRALADFVKVSQQSINQYENRDTEPDIAVVEIDVSRGDSAGAAEVETQRIDERLRVDRRRCDPVRGEIP